MNVLILGFDCGGGEFEGIGIFYGLFWLEDVGLVGDFQGLEGGGDVVGVGIGGWCFCLGGVGRGVF